MLFYWLDTIFEDTWNEMTYRDLILKGTIIFCRIQISSLTMIMGTFFRKFSD